MVLLLSDVKDTRLNIHKWHLNKKWVKYSIISKKEELLEALEWDEKVWLFGNIDLYKMLLDVIKEYPTKNYLDNVYWIWLCSCKSLDELVLRWNMREDQLLQSHKQVRDKSLLKGMTDGTSNSEYPHLINNVVIANTKKN